MQSHDLGEIKVMARGLSSEHGMQRYILLVDHGPRSAAPFIEAIGRILLHTESDVRAAFHKLFRSLNVSSNSTSTYAIVETTKHCLNHGMPAAYIVECAADHTTRAEVIAVLQRESPPPKAVPQPKQTTTAAATMPRYAPASAPATPQSGPVQHVPPPHNPSFPPQPVTKKKP